MIRISVSDKEAPSLSCGSDQRFTTDPGTNTAMAVYQTPIVTDNSGDDISAVCTPRNGTVLPMGSTDVTCVATDGSGNNATCVFRVTIEGTYYFPCLCSAETHVKLQIYDQAIIFFVG